MKINNIQDVVLPPNKKIIFITGVSGQDGSIMSEYLLNKEEPDASIVGGIRRLSVNNHTNINHLENESRFQLVNFDLTDSHSIYKIIEYVKPDYFINFAAQSFVASSWDFSRQTWECNSTAVLDCLEAIKRLRPTCRFYNAGSSEEFGNVVYEPQDENHPARPRSPYGASKSAARTLVKVYRESYGLYAVQGWLFNHEGIRRGEEFVTRKITKGVARIKKAIDEEKSFDVIELGNINSERDWSDADDLIDAVWKMLNQDKYNTKIWENILCGGITNFQNLCRNIKDYVVGSGEKHTIKEFVEKSFYYAGITDGYWSGNGLNECFENDMYVFVKINPKFYRPAEVDVLRADSTKIKKELGWIPKTTFDELVKKMVENDIKLTNIKS